MGRILAHSIIMLTFVPGFLVAQTYLQPVTLSTEEGLSSHHVYDIAVDDAGFLWAATNKGLNRYDGYEFKHFLIPQSSFATQEACEVFKLSTDGLGNLWFLSDAGPGVYVSKTGRIRLFDENLTAYGGNQPVTVHKYETGFIDIDAGEDRTAWVLSDTALLHLVPDGPTEFFNFPEDFEADGIIPTCLAVDGSNIWIGCEQGAISFNLQDRSFKRIDLPASRNTLQSPFVQSLFVDKDETIWFGTVNGLIRFDYLDIDVRTFYPVASGQASSGNEILDVSRLRDGNLVLVTGTGIKSFDVARQRFADIGDIGDDIPYKAVSDAMENIWCASSRGIVKLRKTNLIVENYTSHGQDPRLASDEVIALTSASEDRIWVGYRQEGFDILDTRNLTVQHASFPSGLEIRGFYRNGNNQVVILGRHDLSYYSLNGSRQYTLTGHYAFVDQDLLNGSEINCMLQDNKGRIWIGTSRGVHLIQPDIRRHAFISSLQLNGDTIRNFQVHTIRQNAGGDIWLGTDDNLILYDPGQQNASRYIPYDRDLMNTENKAVFTLAPMDSTTYWIGTSRGIYRFSSRDKEFDMLDDDPNLMNASVYTIAPDLNGNLWIGTDAGLIYYNPSNSSTLFFDPVDGLINYTYASSALDADGNVYVGGEHGLSRVDINLDGQSSVKPRIVITGIYRIEEEARQELYYAVPDTVVLPLRRSSLQISLAMLDLSRPENNGFRYAFARTGKNPGSFQPVVDHHIILSPLSKGKYVLTVRGTNSNTARAPDDATLVIIIEPPFWRSGTVLLLFGLLFAMLLFFGFLRLSRWTSRMSQQGKEKEMIAKQIMEQKEELSLKNKSITDSINYAKRIQTAMLPPVKMLKTDFPSSFILYMPKDIVSGDFYWINKMEEKIFVAAVDCTGHGVPGAFMSIIGFELFRRITNIEGLKRPSDILNRLNEDFHEIFKDVDVVLRDGMDVAFCSIDKANKILEFSGAFNPLYLIRDNKITEIKGDRFAIGLDEIDFMEHTFKNHLIPLQEDDIIYIFSDGFADQFGGPDGKKYKYRRFKHLLLNMHQLDMEKQREILENNVIEWRGEQEQVDDILIIGIKIDF